MLQMDDRNFHVWNYRNFLVNLNDKLTEPEIEFTK